MTCAKCLNDSLCKGFRPRTAVTLLGKVRFSRHYYLCSSCHTGTFPLDAILGLGTGDLTSASDELVCLAGVQTSFADSAQKMLTRLSGLRVCESTVERSTEAAGQRVATIQHAGQTVGPSKAWAWHRDAEGKTVGYISLDATGVAQQGPGGTEAEGRMAYVGMVYNPVPERRDLWADPFGPYPQWEARYVAQVRSLSELATPLRSQAGQVGLNQAQRWVALSDGGSGLEDFVRENFPLVEAVILDFYHVSEYLGKLSKALYPGKEKESQAWQGEWCSRLKREGGGVVLAGLRALELAGLPGSARGVWEEVTRYFENQVERMDYPAYVSKGWQIGSGPVESACKTVVGQRLKGGGMRWGEAGSDAVCHLRALFLSSDRQWEAFWSRN